MAAQGRRYRIKYGTAHDHELTSKHTVPATSLDLLAKGCFTFTPTGQQTSPRRRKEQIMDHFKSTSVVSSRRFFMCMCMPCSRVANPGVPSLRS